MDTTIQDIIKARDVMNSAKTQGEYNTALSRYRQLWTACDQQPSESDPDYRERLTQWEREMRRINWTEASRLKTMLAKVEARS